MTEKASFQSPGWIATTTSINY